MPSIEFHRVDLSAQWQFDKDAAALSPEARTIADDVAARMSEDRAFECIHLGGEISVDESDELAEARARAVRDYLVSRGIEAGRISLSGALTLSYGTPRPVNAGERRVTLHVSVYAGRVPQHGRGVWGMPERPAATRDAPHIPSAQRLPK